MDGGDPVGGEAVDDGDPVGGHITAGCNPHFSSLFFFFLFLLKHRTERLQVSESPVGQSRPSFYIPVSSETPETASARAPMHSSARACACIAAGRRQQGKLESLLAGGCNASEWRRRWAAVVPAALRRLLFRHTS